MGVFSAGAGQYNYNTAAARSINANTAMQWNDYWNTYQDELNAEYYQRLARQKSERSRAATRWPGAPGQPERR